MWADSNFRRKIEILILLLPGSRHFSHLELHYNQSSEEHLDDFIKQISKKKFDENGRKMGGKFRIMNQKGMYSSHLARLVLKEK